MKKCRICGRTEDEVQIISGLCGKHYYQIKTYGRVLERTIYDHNEIVLHDNYAEIILYNKQCEESTRTKIDLDDVEKCKIYKWSIHNQGYVYNVKNNIFLHNLICNDKLIDHINRDRLDNRKCNLRITTKSKNGMNTNLSKANKSGVKGVYFINRLGYWGASINLNYEKHFLGYFKNFNEAVLARKNAEMVYHNI